MATLNVNIPIIEQTAAAWGADATVYPVKRILITSDVLWDGTDQRKYKISNGADTWSNLDYVPFERGVLVNDWRLAEFAHCKEGFSCATLASLALGQSEEVWG